MLNQLSPLNARGLIVSGLICLLLGASTGCVGLAVNLLHAIHGNNRPAEYKGLNNCRVAVVVANEGGVDSDESCSTLTTFIHTSLSANLKKSRVVPQEEIDEWLTKHGTTHVDHVELGRAVKADRVVAVDMLNMELRDGATLYRGFSDVSVTVYDIADGGRIAFRKDYPEFAFPSVGGTPVTDTSETRFRSLYLSVIARRISTLFYEVEATSDFALDATTNRL